MEPPRRVAEGITGEARFSRIPEGPHNWRHGRSSRCEEVEGPMGCCEFNKSVSFYGRTVYPSHICLQAGTQGNSYSLDRS